MYPYRTQTAFFNHHWFTAESVLAATDQLHSAFRPCREFECSVAEHGTAGLLRRGLHGPVRSVFCIVDCEIFDVLSVRMKAESKFRSRAGLKCTVNRVEAAKCCEWCDQVAGKYAYEDTPPDLWRRHDNCNCTIVYGTRRDRQVLRGTEKKWEIVAEGAGAPEPVRLTPEQAQKLQEEHQLKRLTNGRKDGIIKSREVKPMIRAIEQPIEQQHTGKGNPNAILTFDVELNNRQAQLLEQLPDFDSRVTVPKSSVNMSDLSALTAKTGQEFAMFTKGQERLIIRGDTNSVNIDIDTARQLATAGYRWSGHTHPGDSIQSMIASGGDMLVLEQFPQSTSVIYNSKGQYATFGKEE